MTEVASDDKWFLREHPPKVPFVIIRNGLVEPILTAFPSEVWSVIGSYLTQTMIYRLYMTGSARLDFIMRRPGVISEFTLKTALTNTSGFPNRSPHIEWVLRYPTLTTLVLQSSSARCWKGNIHVSNFPRTLTSLKVDHTYALSLFVTEKFYSEYIYDLEDTKMVQYGLAKIYGSNNFSNKKASPFADLGIYLPLLTHLTIPQIKMQDETLVFWLRSLPSTLLYICGPILQPPAYPTYAASDLDIDSCIELLPPSLETLRPAMRRWGSELDLPKRFPSNLKHLHFDMLTTHIDSLKPFSGLLTLHLNTLTISSAESISILPCSLTEFRLNTLRSFVPYASIYTNRLFKGLPRGLTSLKWPHIPDSSHFQYLPPNLTFLHLTASIRNAFTHIHHLPRSLAHWYINTRDTLTPDLMTGFPPTMRTLQFLNATIQDDCLAHMPQSVYEIACSRWLLTGYLLSNTSTIASQQALYDSLKRVPIIKRSSIYHAYCQDLKYCPPSVTMLQDVKVSEGFKMSDLPRSLTSLPSSIPFIDKDDQSVSEVPPLVTRLHVRGATRLQTWLALPSTIKHIRGGSVILEHGDIVDALDTIKEQYAALETNDIGNDSPQRFEKLHIPFSLVDALKSKFSHNEFVCRIPSRDWHVQWENRHFSRLPDFITDLTILAPPDRLPLPYIDETQGDNICARMNAVHLVGELSDNITRLTLGRSTCQVDHPTTRMEEEESLLDGRKRIEFKSIFDSCKLLPSMLPLSLTELSLYGHVQVDELRRISHIYGLKILRLGRLAVDSSCNEKIPYKAFIEFCSLLPPSIEVLHLLKTIFHTSVMEHLPRSLKELKIKEPHSYDAHALQSLPPKLTTLDIHATDIFSGYRELLPSSLVNLTINQNVNPKKNPSPSYSGASNVTRM